MKDLKLSDFPKNSFDDWVDVAEKQLKNEDPIGMLSWESGGIDGIKPFYVQSDLEQLSDQINFFQKLPTHRWKLYEEVKVSSSEKEANRLALAALMGGCDGIIFSIEDKVNADMLMKGIDSSICDVSILNPDYTTHSNRMNCNNTVVETTPKESPINQISWILKSIAGKHHIYRYAFTDFFLEIAALRALRYLLATELDLKHIEIHSQISFNENPEFQWFLNTTSGLASILGGSHSIAMPTSIGESRITRNVGNLIRDESKIEAYSDQCGGSYYIERLTANIVELVKMKTSEQ